jgi:hypothetical protein
MGTRMKAKIAALLAIALIAALSPAVISLAAAAKPAAHTDHPEGPKGTVPSCDFDHPGPLPSQASPNATAAHNERVVHCLTVQAR